MNVKACKRKGGVWDGKRKACLISRTEQALQKKVKGPFYRGQTWKEAIDKISKNPDFDINPIIDRIDKDKEIMAESTSLFPPIKNEYDIKHIEIRGVGKDARYKMKIPRDVEPYLIKSIEKYDVHPTIEQKTKSYEPYGGAKLIIQDRYKDKPQKKH